MRADDAIGRRQEFVKAAGIEQGVQALAGAERAEVRVSVKA